MLNFVKIKKILKKLLKKLDNLKKNQYYYI